MMLNVATEPKMIVSTDCQFMPDVRTVASAALIMASPDAFLLPPRVQSGYEHYDEGTHWSE
jgi:hypothetical protein